MLNSFCGNVWSIIVFQGLRRFQTFAVRPCELSGLNVVA